MKKKGVSKLITGLLVYLELSFSIVCADYGHVLTVTRYQQEKSNWC